MAKSLPNWERLLSHNHWITLHAFGKELHICARCTGTVLGFIGSKIFYNVTSLVNYSPPFLIGFIGSVLFFLPTIVDWITQSLGFRQSNNNLRLLTGFLEGIGLVLLNIINISFIAKFIILIIFGLGVATAGMWGRKLTQTKLTS